MSSAEQRDAVRQIDQNKNTGPTSKQGKAIASQNARRHDVFSAELILEDEDPNDSTSLQLKLQQTLGPVGTIEFALLEKIAITMWRQRRLVSADSTILAAQRRERAIARDASSFRGAGLGRDVGEEELRPFDQDCVDWCVKAIAEIEALDEITVEALKSRARHVWQQLKEDAEDDYETPEDLVTAHNDGATGYVMELYTWCKAELRKAEARPKLLALAEQLKQKRLILLLDQLQLFACYQTTLDNQLYKTLKALRDAQDWRLKTLNAVVDPRSAVPDKAA